jgi:hypothetical protein
MAEHEPLRLNPGATALDVQAGAVFHYVVSVVVRNPVYEFRFQRTGNIATIAGTLAVTNEAKGRITM